MSHHFDGKRGKQRRGKGETRHKLNRSKRLCCLSEVAIKLDGLSGWYYCPLLVFIEVCDALLDLIDLKFIVVLQLGSSAAEHCAVLYNIHVLLDQHVICANQNHVQNREMVI